MTKHEKMVAALCSELACTENCPYHTEEGCPRPLEEREAGFENSGMCFKCSRRSRFGAECWRLWAEKKINGGEE